MDAKTDPHHEITLYDPSKKDVGLQQTLPSGYLESNGQEAVGAGFFAPSGSKKVRFVCAANAALTPGFTCRTHSFGITKQKTAIGLLGTWTTIDVDLAASNVNASVDFRTTDSNGGNVTGR